MTNAKRFVHLAIRAFDEQGTRFPIWGTCLGLQALAVIVDGSDRCLSASHGTWDVSLPLRFTPDVKQSRMMSQVRLKSLIRVMSTSKGLYPLVQVFCNQEVQAPNSFVFRHARQVKIQYKLF